MQFFYSLILFDEGKRKVSYFFSLITFRLLVLRTETQTEQGSCNLNKNKHGVIM